jgi:phage-related baseplate assembly protein
MALPTIFEEDVQAKLSRLQIRLETALGRALAPADIEMLIANAFVYELQLQCIAANQAVRQCLVNYSTGTMLEELGYLVGVKRLPASAAECTIKFILVDGHNAVQLPAGVRVQSIDGNVIFITTVAVDIAIGVTDVSVPAVCQAFSVKGNGYDAGKISIILDPQPFVTTAANTDTTSGGNDEETDDQLRERIKLAPASFSVAGPTDAYKFFAKSAHPSIVDVAPVTTNPGEITLYPLCTGGIAPSVEIKAAVLAKCSDQKVRPQNDTVLVDDPTITEYAIEVELVTYTGAINQEVLDAVNANLAAFKAERDNKLGMDVIVEQISALSVVKDKVYKPTVISPAADIVADEKTFLKCTGILVTITGSNDG